MAIDGLACQFIWWFLYSSITPLLLSSDLPLSLPPSNPSSLIGLSLSCQVSDPCLTVAWVLDHGQWWTIAWEPWWFSHAYECLILAWPLLGVLTVDSDGRLPGELPWWIVNQGSCGHLTVLSLASWGWLWGEFKSLPSTSYNKVWICHQGIGEPVNEKCMLGDSLENLLDMLHPNRQVSGYEVRRPCPMADATVLTIPLKLHLTKTRWSKTIAYGICATVDKKCLLETHPPTSCPHQV